MDFFSARGLERQRVETILQAGFCQYEHQNQKKKRGNKPSTPFPSILAMPF
jgi:hypothetical protein